MKTILTLYVWAAACGSGHSSANQQVSGKPAPVKPVPRLCVDVASVEGKVMDVEALAKASKAVSADNSKYGAAFRAKFGSDAAGEYAVSHAGATVLVHNDCGDSCDVRAVVVAGGKVTASAVLPNVAGTGVTDTSVIHDMTGDGEAELWIRYAVDGEEEAAVGATTKEYLAAFSLPLLTPLLQADLGTFPGAMMGERCEAQVRTADVTCDGVPDLVIDTTCGVGLCFDGDAASDPECKGVKLTKERSVFVWAADRYVAARKN